MSNWEQPPVDPRKVMLADNSKYTQRQRRDLLERYFIEQGIVGPEAYERAKFIAAFAKVIHQHYEKGAK